MEILRYESSAGPRLGLLVDDQVAPLGVDIDSRTGVEALLDIGADELSALCTTARRRSERCALSQLRLVAPVPRPGKILAVGLNYATHVAESGLAAPEVPTIFAKLVNTIAGPYDAIQRPSVSPEVDYEGELAFVISKRCHLVPRSRAHEVIGGFFAFNDVSVRSWQRASSQWTMGKSFDTHAPSGPWVTLAGDVDPHDLGLRTWVNGDLRQETSTSDLIFDCFSLVEHISQAVTLEPGDIIATGTPGGVGFLMDPPQYLRPGDTVKVEIEGLGALVNPVIDEPLTSARIAGETLTLTDPAMA
jgi:2-keto-4-pentenoate hydratase/2-oxohepta-3-ene-1,7-dioic acid hydratase in catechol pathway